MNKALEALFDDIRALPQAAQDEIAEVIEDLLGRGWAQDQAKREAVAAGIADANAGRFASDAEVEAVLNRLRNA